MHGGGWLVMDIDFKDEPNFSSLDLDIVWHEDILTLLGVGCTWDLMFVCKKVV